MGKEQNSLKKVQAHMYQRQFCYFFDGVILGQKLQVSKFQNELKYEVIGSP